MSAWLQDLLHGYNNQNGLQLKGRDTGQQGGAGGLAQNAPLIFDTRAKSRQGRKDKEGWNTWLLKAEPEPLLNLAFCVKLKT